MYPLLSFFDHNPPPQSLVSELFCNRTRELRVGLARLRNNPQSNTILAVHGPRRVGKSHFVRELLQRLVAQDGGWRIVTINASTRGEVRNVLEDIYFELWKALVDLAPKVIDSERAHYDAFVKDMERERPLVYGEFAERTNEMQVGATEAMDAGIELRAVAGTFRAGARGEHREQHTERATARVYGDREVVECVRKLLDALGQFEPARPILLFVDDLDLLDRQGREASEVSAKLVDRLASVAEHRSALVLVTVREMAFSGERGKSFNDFVRLDHLGDDEIRAVYRRHVEVFNKGRDVFSDDVLEALLRSADGRVGIFLRTCRDFWGHFAPEPGTVLGRAELAEFLRARLHHFRRSEETMHHVPVIERALEDGVAQVEIPGGLADSPLLYFMLFPVPGQKDRYTVSPIWGEAFAARQGAQRS